MQLLGADSDLRPQTELRAVCKGGRRIRVDACGIYRGYEFPAGLFVFRDYGFAVSRAILRYVPYCII